MVMKIRQYLGPWKGVKEATFRGCEKMSKFQACPSVAVKVIINSITEWMSKL